VTVGSKPDDRKALYSIMILQDLGEDTGSTQTEDTGPGDAATSQDEVDPRAR